MGKKYADGRKAHIPRHIWTAEETAILEESWGRISPDVIARRLGVTLGQVRYKSKAMRLGQFRYASDRVEACTIYQAIRGSDCYMDPADWLREHGLALHQQRNVKRIYWYTDLAAVWEWLRDHRDTPNWERFERGDLGPEPAWVDAERQARRGGRGYYRGWNRRELERLDREVEAGYTLDEIGAMHGRSANAIHHQVRQRGRLYPVPARARPWSAEENALCSLLASQGADVVEIARQLRRPQGSIYKKLQELRRKEKAQ